MGQSTGVLVTGNTIDGVFRISLNKPSRRNSLTPEMLEALNVQLDRVDPAVHSAVVLEGAGKSFSSGGDVKRFAELSGSQLETYADDVVSSLNAAILKLLALPIPVVARLQGFVTGGSVGFVLASDVVVMADDAFIAPYYSVVGFSPDGGWTALLPDMIGASRALEVQIMNRHIEAEEALRLGLATHITSPHQLDDKINRILSKMIEKSKSSIRATKELIWSENELQQAAAKLDAERQSFIRQIVTAEATERMQAFLTDR